MDYEKYKEALESAKGIINYYKEHNRGDESAIEDLEIIFPELKESEDEKIRKELTKFLKNASGGFLDTTIRCKTFGKWAAWLEKQGEKKPTWSDEDDKTYYSLLADIRARQDSSTSTLEAYYNEQINWLKSLKERLS